MEKLVPDQVPYVDFWKRYYFLRHGIETAEARRRDLLKGESIVTSQQQATNKQTAASAEDDVAWSDDDSDDDSDDSADTSTPATKTKVEPKTEPKTELKTETKTETKATPAAAATPATASSNTTQPAAKTLLKPAEPRKSNDEKSQADSEASYDVVGAASGKTTQTPNSPKDSKDSKKKEESSEIGRAHV